MKLDISYSVIVPNYNSADFIEDFLTSLPKFKGELIIVDNGSTDDSILKIDKFTNSLKIKNFKLKIIFLKKNYGFASAVNTGIKKAKFNHVVVLNNDVYLNKNWFLKISAAIKKYPFAAAWCGTVLNQEGTKIESQGLDYDMSGRCTQINHNLSLELVNLELGTSSVWGSSAAAVVYNKNVLQKVGLFDESFFAYIEDVDLAYRLHRAGYQTILTRSAVCRHTGGATSSKMGILRQYYTLRNWLKLIFKNYSKKEIILNFPGILLERLRNFSYLIKSLVFVNINR